MTHAKLTISLPEESACAVDGTARSLAASSSMVVAQALRARFRRLQSEEMTRRINEVWDSLTPEEIEYELAPLRAAARATHLRLLAEEEEPWQMP